MISFIWAMDRNRVIGNENQLPWHLPEDLKFFKRMTMGHPIVMGRKTHESIGRVLPGRENIVLTRDDSYHKEGVTILHSVVDLQKYNTHREQEIFIIGGAEIFRELLHVADKLYLTLIHEEFNGDTFFPEINWGEWKLISKEIGLKDESNPFQYEFLIYERK